MPLTIENFKAAFSEYLGPDVGDDPGVLEAAIGSTRAELRVSQRRLGKLAAALRSEPDAVDQEVGSSDAFTQLLAAQTTALEKAIGGGKRPEIHKQATAFAKYLASDPLVALIDAPNPYKIELRLRTVLKDALDHLAEQTRD